MRHPSICEALAETQPVVRVVYVIWPGESRAAAQEGLAHSALEQAGRFENGEKCRLLLEISRADSETHEAYTYP